MKEYYDYFLKQEELGVKISELKKEMISAYEKTRKNIFLVVENYDISHVLPELVGRKDVFDYVMSIFEISRFDLNNYNPKLTEIPEMVNAIESASSFDSVKKLYYVNILRFITLITKHRQELFSSEILSGIADLAKEGYCLYFIKIPFEKYDLNKEFIADFYLKNNSLRLLELLKSVMIDAGAYGSNIDYSIYDALDSLYVRDFDICAQELFDILRIERKKCSQSYKKFFNTFIINENINNEALVNLLSSDNIDYYTNAWHNCYELYKNITTKKVEYTMLNRNNLGVGKSTREDCLKLFLLFASFKEMSFLLEMLIILNDEIDNESTLAK